MRSLVKLILASVSRYSGLISLLSKAKRYSSPAGDTVILMYHRVLRNPDTESDHTEPGLVVSTDTFNRQMQFLSRNYRVISLQKLIQYLRDGETPPRRTVVITFDDGWRDNYTEAFPVLKKYGIPATIFLTADMVGTNRRFWFHEIGNILGATGWTFDQILELMSKVRPPSQNLTLAQQWKDDLNPPSILLDWLLERLKAYHPDVINLVIEIMQKEANLTESETDKPITILNWEEVNEMHLAGIDFGSHGRSHSILTRLNKSEIADDLKSSVRTIKEHVDTVSIFCFQIVNTNADICRQVEECNYIGSVVTSDYPPDLQCPSWFRLRRIGVNEGLSVIASRGHSDSLFAFGICGWRDPLKGNV